jgi:hypothetical protein
MFKKEGFSGVIAQLVSLILIILLPSTSIASVAGPRRIVYAPVEWVTETELPQPSPQLTEWARNTLSEFRKAGEQPEVAPIRTTAHSGPAGNKLPVAEGVVHRQFHGVAEPPSLPPSFDAMRVAGVSQQINNDGAGPQPAALERISSPAASPGTNAIRDANASVHPSASQLFARQPLHFEPNRGQADPTVNYLARGKGYQVLLTAGEALIVTRPADDPKRQVALRLTLDHAAASAPQGRELLPGQSNYFSGHDAGKWIRQVPNYAEVAYPGVYPGIELAYYGHERTLEYDFRVAPGADPALIAFRFPDHPALTLDDAGALQARLGGAGFALQRPVAYQQVKKEGKGERHAVDADFALNPDGSVGFRLGAYDHSLPLVIDPVVTLTYATFLGGTYGQDEADAVKADAAGNAYVMSTTHSTDFPVTSGAFQTTNTSDSYIAAISKFDPTGSKLLYSTYLGNGEEFFPSLAINSAGQAVLASSASDPTFPTTPNAYLPSDFYGLSVVAQLDPTGSKLLYSTFFPNQLSSYHGVAEDDAGRIYVIGTAGSGVPVTGTAYETSLPSGVGSAAFLSEFDPSKSGQASLAYSTYLGASTTATAVAVDSQQNAYVVGNTDNCFGSGCGPQYPPIKNAFQPKSGGNEDAYIAKISTRASGDGSLIYGSYLGGTGTDLVAGVALDASNNAYMAGYTEPATGSTINFPTTPGAYQTASSLSEVAFISKVSADGKTLIYSALLGTSSTDNTQGGTSALDLAVDGLGQVQLLGSTSTPGFPLLNAYSGSPAAPGGGLNFITGFNATGTALLYSTLVPIDSFQAIAADPLGNVYIVGSGATGVGGITPTSGAFQQTCVANGYCDVVMKFNYGGSTGVGGTVSISSVDPNEGGQEDIVHLTVSGTGFADGASLTLSNGTASIAATSVVVASGGGSLSADVDLHGAALGSYSVTVTNPDSSNAVASGAFTVVPDVAAIVTNAQGVAGSLATTSITAPSVEAGAVVTLAQKGVTAATATNVSVGNGAVTATFDLTKVPAGVYDVVIANPDGGVITLPASFTVGLTGSSQPSIDIIGRTVLRGGQQQYYYIVIGNQGNEDAEMVHFRVKFPPYFQFTLGTTLTQIQTTSPLPANTVPYDVTLVPPGQPAEDGTTAVDLYLPYVAAGQTYSIPFEFLVADVSKYAHVPFVIDGEVDPGQFQPTPPTILTSEFVPGQGLRRVIPMVAGGLTPAQQACLGKLALALLVLVPAFGGLSKSAWLAATATAAAIMGSVVPFNNPLAIQPINMSQIIWDAVAGALAIAGIAWPPALIASAVISILNHFDDLKAAYDACKDAFPPPPPPCSNPPKKGKKHGSATPSPPPCPTPPKGNGRRHKQLSGSTVVSGDPNDKSGPIGAGTQQYIQGKLALPYGVYFENDATASAPAQTVVVTDQLNPAKVDLTTFNFGPVYISNQTLMPEPGSQNFTGQLDLRPANNVIASVTGNLNAKTGLLQWTFTSLDPTTGKPVTDPTAGFLPPNTAAVSPQGDGAVSFNVKALSSIATGVAITNQATVVFDQNAAIMTPVWSNTVDHDPPSSKVTALASTEPAVFPLTWSGTDAGSGVAQYSIYVSDNKGPFHLWQVESGSSDTYNGMLRHTYAFYSIAEDFAGNIEAPKTTAEATTTVSTGSTSTSIALVSTAMQILPSGTATITATVSGKNPTGNVLFTINDVPQDPIALTSGAAAMDVSTLPGGPNDIVAFYSGDSANAPSTAGPLTVTVLPAVTTLSISAPAVQPGVAAQIGVTAANSARAVNGSVQVTVNSQAYAVSLTNNQGSVTLPVLPGGSYPVTAFFSGGGDQSQAEATGTLVVQQAASTTALTSSATGSVTAGQSVTLTATVSGLSGGPVPTGSVQFSAGTTALGTGQLSGSAVATLAVTTLPAGTDTVTATYSGDNMYTGSTGTLQIVVVAPPPPTFTVAVSAPSLTVSGQGAGTETVSVTPQNGFSQQVSLGCSGAPQNATCTISPAAVTPSGSTAATATLTISTGVSTAALASPGGFGQPANATYAANSGGPGRGPGNRPGSPEPADPGKLFGLCVLGLGGLLRARRRIAAANRRKITVVLSLFLFAFAVLLGGMLSGCGSSSHMPPPTQPITPAGTSTITITATAGSAVQTTTFTLTVN